MGVTKGRRERVPSVRSGEMLANLQASLESIRLERGLNRRGFAKLIGLPQSSYFNLLSKAANPRLDTIVGIAERVGVDPCRLFQPPSDREPSDSIG